MNKRNQQRYEETQARILDVAQVLVQQNGFERLSLREIARYAEYSPAALYEYFDGKDHIIDSLCERLDSRIASLYARGAANTTCRPWRADLFCQSPGAIDTPLWDVDDAAPSLVLLSLRYSQFFSTAAMTSSCFTAEPCCQILSSRYGRFFCSAAESRLSTPLSFQQKQEKMASALVNGARFCTAKLNRQAPFHSMETL